jgi:NADPH-dependent curcumin reductase
MTSGSDRLGLLRKWITMQGFIIFEDCGEFVAQMSAWFQEGTIKFREDILHGYQLCLKPQYPLRL